MNGKDLIDYICEILRKEDILCHDDKIVMELRKMSRLELIDFVETGNWRQVLGIIND